MPQQRKGRQTKAAGPFAFGSSESQSSIKGEETEMARLLGLDSDALRLRWRAVFAHAAPGHLSKPLMARVLAYRMQAEVHGDLSSGTSHFLDGVVRGKNGADERANASLIIPGNGQLSVGTTLVREHGGERHQVRVAENGFAWKDTVYPSLTKVAHAITGTNWNGPRFFGLRDKPKSRR
jgi:hypothetical protein